ncbi:hypothetical protein [Paenibacillus sp. QZ-Y1]|uniref:hypothetical protein n=1 Tax=Paenibacillus sp. QZ-Y1 TaxID=3414511 RepID=UPI003F7A6398
MNINNNQEFDALHKALTVAMDASKASLDEVKNIRDEIYNNVVEVKAIGNFMLDFYKEYRKDDRVTSGQKKTLKKEMANKASKITKMMFPSIREDKTKKSEFYKEWNKVSKGLWSIYRHMVNDNQCGYTETPKVKYEAAMKYIERLSMADYMAYRDFRWKDIIRFSFDLIPEDEITVESIVESYKDSELVRLERNPRFQ